MVNGKRQPTDRYSLFPIGYSLHHLPFPSSPVYLSLSTDSQTAEGSWLNAAMVSRERNMYKRSRYQSVVQHALLFFAGVHQQHDVTATSRGSITRRIRFEAAFASAGEANVEPEGLNVAVNAGFTSTSSRLSRRVTGQIL